MMSVFQNVRRRLLAGLAWIGLAGSAPAADTFALDGYAATVNDRVITVGEALMAARAADREILAGAADVETARTRLRKNYARALRALVDQALMLEEAKRRELKVPDRAIDDQLATIIHERFADNRTAFLKALADDRITYAQYRDQTRDQLITLLLRRDEMRRRAAVPPGAVRRAYEERREQYRVPERVKLRVIRLAGAGLDAAARDALPARARALRDRLAQGEDFAAVARAESADAHAAAGGDWSWLETDTLAPELAKALAPLSAGQLSDVVAVESDLYIVRLEARREALVKAFDEVRPDLEKQLQAEEEERTFREWMQRLEERHFVKILQPERPE